MLTPMSPTTLTVLLGLLQLAGLAILAWCHLRVIGKQTETVRLLALFQKSNTPADVVAMQDIIDPAKKPQKVEVKPAEEMFAASELGADALTQIRKDMSPE